MDTPLTLYLTLALLLPPLLIGFCVLVYSELSLRKQLRMERQRLRESPRLTKGNRRLYLIDPDKRN